MDPAADFAQVRGHFHFNTKPVGLQDHGFEEVCFERLVAGLHVGEIDA